VGCGLGKENRGSGKTTSHSELQVVSATKKNPVRQPEPVKPILLILLLLALYDRVLSARVSITDPSLKALYGKPHGHI